MSHNQTSIDWLSFTLRDRSDLRGAASFIAGVFGGDVASAVEGGLFGYTQQVMVLGSGRVLWNPDRPDMGVHVMLGSKALQRCGMAPLALLGMLADLGAVVTRLDVCVDTEGFSIDTFWDAIQAGQLVSMLRRGVRVEQFSAQDGSSLPGMTIYLGAPTSDRRVRIYDKAAEQGLAEGVWTRFEVQHRGDHAQRAAEHLLSGASASDLLVSAADFRVVGSDSNSSRRARAGWWASIVEGASKLSFAVEDVVRSVQQVAAWVDRQIGSSLAMLTIAANGDSSWLRSVIERGFDRVSGWRRQQALAYQKGVYRADFGLCVAC